jgi:hypothetical protein
MASVQSRSSVHCSEMKQHNLMRAIGTKTLDSVVEAANIGYYDSLNEDTGCVRAPCRGGVDIGWDNWVKEFPIDQCRTAAAEIGLIPA